MNIGILPFDSDPAHVMHRWRYDVLIRNLPGSGHAAEYFKENKKYDAVIAPLILSNETIFCDLYNAGIPIIGDAVDDILTFPYANYILPGRIYYYFKFNIIENSFSRIGRMIKNCRRLVVGSRFQRDKFLKLNKNTAVVTDAVTDDILSFRASYGQKKPCRILWFGNVASLHGFKAMGKALDLLAAQGGYQLVLITSDYRQGRYLGKRPRTVNDFIRDQKIDCRWVNWNYATFLAEAASCHIGIVPVDCGSPYVMAKPAGRALLMMGMGLPVVAGPVDSYVETMQEGVTGFIARRPQDWFSIISQLGNSSDLRKGSGLNAARFVKDNFSEKMFTHRYLEVINSL